MDEATVSPEGRMLLQTLTDSIKELNANIVTLTHTVQENEIARIESEARVQLSLQMHDQRIKSIEDGRALEARAAEKARADMVASGRHQDTLRVGWFAGCTGLVVWLLDHLPKLLGR